MILYNVNYVSCRDIIFPHACVIFKLTSALLNINNEYNNINKEYK